jgi:EAL and modified HD-GYP domain-containing signal transduction protein
MQEHAVLGQVALGYSPMIDRQRNVVATRLTVFPERPDAEPDPLALLRALSEVWPEAGAPEPLKLSPRPLDPGAVGRRAAEAAEAVRPPLSLNLAGEGLLRGVLDAVGAGAVTQLMLEVPAFMAGDPAYAAALRQAHAGGCVLLIKGRPTQPLPPEVLALFSHSIVEVSEDRRSAGPPPQGTTRSVTTVQAGARSAAEIEAAFARGAVAVLGWPFGSPDEPPPKPSSRQTVPTDVNVVMELINGVDREAPVQQLEAALKRDPTLAFRLMRYLNSPAFGLRVEINSFGHALMLLGYQRLKRWLALLLASSAKGINARPVMHAAVRRGLLMEELGRDHGDAEMRGEMFICGVFSLLDRLLEQPLPQLLKSLPVPERVQQALREDGDGGPYRRYLQLVQAIEQESLFDVREHAEALMLGTTAVNRAVLTALRAGRQLDG